MRGAFFESNTKEGNKEPRKTGNGINRIEGKGHPRRFWMADSDVRGRTKRSVQTSDSDRGLVTSDQLQVNVRHRWSANPLRDFGRSGKVLGPKKW